MCVIFRNNFDWSRDHHQWGINKKQNGWSTQHFGQPLTLLATKIIMGNCAIFQSDDHDPHHNKLLPSIPTMMVIIFVIINIITSPWKMVYLSILDQPSYICMILTRWRFFQAAPKIKCLCYIHSKGFWYRRILKKDNVKRKKKGAWEKKLYIIFQREK